MEFITTVRDADGVEFYNIIYNKLDNKL